MEDRYLFKAKRIDNGEWVQGYLVETRHNTYHDVYRIIDKNGINYDELDYYEPSFISYVIDKTTICQCTGLKDKNGKLIWENDIIKCKFGIAVAVWDKSEWRIKWVKDNIWRKDLHYWVVEDNQRTEVIGNKFDNPELLESEE